MLNSEHHCCLTTHTPTPTLTPKRKQTKPLAMHIEYDQEKARTPVFCEIG